MPLLSDRTSKRDRTMTDRITQDKLDRVSETIEQLNKELHPLVVRAVLIDPMMLKAPLTNRARARLIDDIFDFIMSLASMVREQ